MAATVPTSYTDQTLAEYMHGLLAEMAAALGWSVDNGDYDDPILDCLIEYGNVSYVADCTDIKKLRCLARVAVWDKVVAATSGDFNFSADGASYSREQVHNHAVARLAAAKTAALPYLSSNTIEIYTADYPNDPYTPYTDDRSGL